MRYHFFCRYFMCFLFNSSLQLLPREGNYWLARFGRFHGCQWAMGCVQVQQRHAAKTKQHFENIQVLHVFWFHPHFSWYFFTSSPNNPIGFFFDLMRVQLAQMMMDTFK